MEGQLPDSDEIVAWRAAGRRFALTAMRATRSDGLADLQLALELLRTCSTGFKVCHHVRTILAKLEHVCSSPRYQRVDGRDQEVGQMSITKAGESRLAYLVHQMSRDHHVGDFEELSDQVLPRYALCFPIIDTD